MPTYPIMSAARLHVIRGNIRRALDALNTPNPPEKNRLEAIGALAQALGMFEEVQQ